jgi:hypothetical protein
VRGGQQRGGYRDADRAAVSAPCRHRSPLPLQRPDPLAGRTRLLVEHSAAPPRRPQTPGRWGPWRTGSRPTTTAGIDDGQPSVPLRSVHALDLGHVLLGDPAQGPPVRGLLRDGPWRSTRLPARWAGSPAASSPIWPRPNPPSPWPSGWAASTPPRRSWARPGHRCARPSPATAWACRPPTPKPSACGPSTRPASAPGGRLPRPWTRCSWHSTRAPSPPVHGRRLSCTSGSPRRAVRHLGASVVVELYSESHARRPTTRAWAIIRRADRSDRLADQRTSRADRRQAEAPHGPRTDHSRSRSGDARRCPLTPLASAV